MTAIDMTTTHTVEVGYDELCGALAARDCERIEHVSAPSAHRGLMSARRPRQRGAPLSDRTSPTSEHAGGAT